MQRHEMAARPQGLPLSRVLPGCLHSPVRWSVTHHTQHPALCYILAFLCREIPSGSFREVS